MDCGSITKTNEMKAIQVPLSVTMG